MSHSIYNFVGYGSLGNEWFASQPEILEEYTGTLENTVISLYESFGKITKDRKPDIVSELSDWKYRSYSDEERERYSLKGELTFRGIKLTKIKLRGTSGYYFSDIDFTISFEGMYQLRKHRLIDNELIEQMKENEKGIAQARVKIVHNKFSKKL